jgi:hypothetical protein
MEINRTEEDWVAYFEEIHGTEIRIYIEKGRRIREFHDAYHQERWKFGNRWEDACKRVVRLSKSICSYYETVYRVLGRMDEEQLAKIITQLPADVYSLNFICRSLEINEEFVLAMIEQKTITPEIGRDDVDALFSLAQTIQTREHNMEKEQPPDEVKDKWPQQGSTGNLLPQEDLPEALKRISENHEILPAEMSKFVPIILDIYKMERHRSDEFEFLIACTGHGNTLRQIGLWMRKFGLDGILDTRKYLEPWMKEKLDKYEKEMKERTDHMEEELAKDRNRNK